MPSDRQMLGNLFKKTNTKDIFSILNDKKKLIEVKNTYRQARRIYKLQRKTRTQQLRYLEECQDQQLNNMFSYCLLSELKKDFAKCFNQEQVLQTIVWGFKVFKMVDDRFSLKRPICRLLSNKFSCVTLQGVEACAFLKFLETNYHHRNFYQNIVELAKQERIESFLNKHCDDCTEVANKEDFSQLDDLENLKESSDTDIDYHIDIERELQQRNLISEE